MLESKEVNYKGSSEEEQDYVARRELDHIFSRVEVPPLSIAEKVRSYGAKIREDRLIKGLPSRSSLYRFGEFLVSLISTMDDKKFLHMYQYQKEKKKINIQYHIKCMDARPIVKELMGSRGIVCMSGTLEPIDAYLDLCGFSRFDTAYKVLPSPFSPKQLLIITVQGLNTKYYNRTPSNYRVFKKRCLEVIENSSGNIGIFCASYKVLAGLISAGLASDIDDLKIEKFIGRRDLTSKENDVMVREFKSVGFSGNKAVLLDVIGGRNSEGVDFPGPEMNAVVIVGLPLPRLKKESFASFLELYRIIKALDFIFVALCDDKVAGFAVLIPNLYDKWDGGKVSRANWLIGDVSKDMRGRVWNKIKNTVHRFLEKSGILSYEG
ncbi:MAG: helicase C-terminal domain-containing protein, partial [Candidatus Helarchaeota archaeon]